MAHDSRLPRRLERWLPIVAAVAGLCGMIADGQAAQAQGSGVGLVQIQARDTPRGAEGSEAVPPLTEQDLFRYYKPRAPKPPSENEPETGRRDAAPEDDDGPGCPANKRPLDLLV